MQLVSDDVDIFTGLSKESVITVTGLVRKRSEEDYNERIETGKLELVVEELDVISKANTLPFEIMTSHEVNEELRLKYRYLDLRNKKVHDTIILRSKVLKHLRDKMDSLGFTEVQTPIITASINCPVINLVNVRLVLFAKSTILSAFSSLLKA